MAWTGQTQREKISGKCVEQQRANRDQVPGAAITVYW